MATEEVCLLMPGYLSQEIWESGQLKKSHSPFPHHHIALTGTKDSKTEIPENIFRIPLYRRTWSRSV